MTGPAQPGSSSAGATVAGCSYATAFAAGTVVTAAAPGARLAAPPVRAPLALLVLDAVAPFGAVLRGVDACWPLDRVVGVLAARSRCAGVVPTGLGVPVLAGLAALVGRAVGVPSAAHPVVGPPGRQPAPPGVSVSIAVGVGVGAASAAGAEASVPRASAPAPPRPAGRTAAGGWTDRWESCLGSAS